MSKYDEITNNENIIDSRDVIARIEYLESEHTDFQDALEACDDMDESSAHNLEQQEKAREQCRAELENWIVDNGEELRTLQNLASQCEGYGDWQYGEQLISADYFTEYAKELCSDIGDLPKDIPDYIVIDWEATAENIKADYMTADFDGNEYLMRA